MKIHFYKPFSQYSGMAWTGCNKKIPVVGYGATDDYIKATCLHCIANMSPGEQAWHDKNNRAWIEHKQRDKRRK